MDSAESCLDNLVSSVNDGTVIVATLTLLDKKSDQFLKVDEVYQVNKKCGTPTKYRFLQRISEMKAFLTFKNSLRHFIGFSNIFTSGKRDIFLLE